MKAFPFVVPADEHNGAVVYMGMDLRDYFAASSINGLLASYAGIEDVFFEDKGLATHAYKIADAMMKAREQ
jgi:hypothetical protein